MLLLFVVVVVDIDFSFSFVSFVSSSNNTLSECEEDNKAALPRSRVCCVSGSYNEPLLFKLQYES